MGGWRQLCFDKSLTGDHVEAAKADLPAMDNGELEDMQVSRDPFPENLIDWQVASDEEQLKAHSAAALAAKE